MPLGSGPNSGPSNWHRQNSAWRQARWYDAVPERYPSGMVTAQGSLVAVRRPTVRTTSSIEPVPQLLGCAEQVTVGDQIGHLVPVGAAVEHHAHGGGRPW